MAQNNWKATIVFFSMDAYGHIHPILSIVKELRQRGFRAIILTTLPLSLASNLEAEGFELEYCQEKVEDSAQQSDEKLRQIIQPLMEKFRKGPAKTFEFTYSIDGAVGKYLDDIIEKHSLIEAKLRSLKPDLIVVDHVVGVPCSTKVAPKWVRIYSGFPSNLFSFHNESYVPGMGLKVDEMTPNKKQFELKIKSPLREKTRRYWAEQRMSDWPNKLDLVPTSPFLNFYLGPEELGLEKVTTFKPLPNDWFRLEHTIADSEETSKFDIPQNLLDQPGKLIYFSLGTLVSSDVSLINRLLEMLSKSPHKFIVSKGQMHKQIKLYPNMWGDKFLDQKAILPNVDLFITHGGHNSIIEAFYYGVPGIIVLPVFADQFDCAQRVEDCNFGFRLNPFECEQEELLKSIDSLLNNDQLKQRMKTISLRLKSIKYHQVAADKLEKLLL